MDAEGRRLRLKTRLFLLIVVFSNAFGDFFLTLGTRPFKSDLGLSPLGYITAILSPLTALGVALLIVWMLTRMALLGFADLSYVLPATAVGYIIVAVLGRVFLHEQITSLRWCGIALIVCGTILVGLTRERTAGGTP